MSHKFIFKFASNLFQFKNEKGKEKNKKFKKDLLADFVAYIREKKENIPQNVMPKVFYQNE